jgi:hypothetical protein
MAKRGWSMAGLLGPAFLLVVLGFSCSSSGVYFLLTSTCNPPPLGCGRDTLEANVGVRVWCWYSVPPGVTGANLAFTRSTAEINNPGRGWYTQLEMSVLNGQYPLTLTGAYAPRPLAQRVLVWWAFASF